MLASHPQKNDITIRLEPLLKEALVSAHTVPTTAAKLKAFVEKTKKDTGLSIEYGDDCLNRDNWAVEILEDKEYAKALKENMNPHGGKEVDIFTAV